MCHRNNIGFTLVEVMIAIVIGIILVTAVSATYVAQNRSYVAQESVSEINTQSKISHDLIANAVRGAGFGVPANIASNPVNATLSVIESNDSAALTDAITIVSGRLLGQLWPVGVGPGMIPCAPTEPLTTIPAGTNPINIIYSSAVRPNNTDMSNLSIDGIEPVDVLNVGFGFTVTLQQGLPKDFPLLDTDGDGLCDTGRSVYLLEDTTFCVDGNSSLRRIRRNAVLPACTGIASSDDDVIADNIEDLQFAYAFDATLPQDGFIDDVNGSNMLDGGDFLNGGANPDATIRAVRINVLARADRADINYTGQGNPPVAIENRAHPQPGDDFKRRWLRSIVTMRNQ